MARTNERGFELSFKRIDRAHPRGRWFTRVGGKVKYFGYGNGVSARESYNAALIKYRAWKTERTDKLEMEQRGLPQELVRYERSMQGWGQLIKEIGEKTLAARNGCEVIKIGGLFDEFLAEQKKRYGRRAQ